MNGSVAPLYTYCSLPNLATAPDGASLKRDVLLKHGAAAVGAQRYRERLLHEVPPQAFHDRHLDPIVSAIRSSVHARPPSGPSAPSARSSTYVCLSLRTSALPHASSAASSSRSASVSVTDASSSHWAAVAKNIADARRTRLIQAVQQISVCSVTEITEPVGPKLRSLRRQQDAIEFAVVDAHHAGRPRRCAYHPCLYPGAAHAGQSVSVRIRTDYAPENADADQTVERWPLELPRIGLFDVLTLRRKLQIIIATLREDTLPCPIHHE